jgi:hypothetical protein
MIKLLKNFKNVVLGLKQGIQEFKLYKRGKVK